MNFKHVTCAIPLLLASQAFAADPFPTGVASANPKAPGIVQPNILSPELYQTPVATGAMQLENPSGIFKFYGYNDDGPMIPTTPGSNLEAHKTEPDKNVYLILKHQSGGDSRYDYGTHFLFQGHETGVSGYITRVNLDADGPHRVTLMSASDVNGAVLPTYDGITWYPFSQRLLLTAEGSLGGGVWQATLDVPSKVEGLTGIMGQGGFEGIQSDDQGRIMIVEDASGASGTVNNLSKRPGSFIFRFIPKNTSDLTKGGKLQALQVTSLAHSGPISFNFFPSADAAILSQDVKDLHTYGKTFDTTWVTIHDTDVDGFATFNANTAAKAHDATPFKRPENGQFRPGSGFNEFIFAETGDTNLNNQAGTTFGGFGAIFRLRLMGNNSGKLTLVFNGDAVHSSFDNCAFWDANRIVFVEDGGDTLHTQNNALDSAWLFDLKANYATGAQPVRVLAEGRDASATLDSILTSTSGFRNEGDNEITGWHFSDGDPTVRGLLGAKIPDAFEDGWRLFYTQQHGDNNTWEVLSKNGDFDGDDHGHGH